MNSQVKKLTFTALMAAMITIFTAYICHIPVGQNGGYILFILAIALSISQRASFHGRMQ